MSLTQAGVILGSPQYMAPEQARNISDPRSDVYSLGVVLYQMLLGRPPFLAEQSIDIIVKHINEPPPAFAAVWPNHTIPPEVEALVMKCLAKRPADRFDSMDAVLESMRRATANAGVSGVFTGPRSIAGTNTDSGPLTGPVTAPAAGLGLGRLDDGARHLRGGARDAQAPQLAAHGPVRRLGAHRRGRGPDARPAHARRSDARHVTCRPLPEQPVATAPPARSGPTPADPTESRWRRSRASPAPEAMATPAENAAPAQPQPLLVRFLIASEPSGARVTLRGQEPGRRRRWS